MNRANARTLLTIAMYSGVAIFLLPYFINRARHSSILMLLGAIIAVACGLLRCYLQEGE